MPAPAKVCVYAGDDLARYGFGPGHPFGPDRLHAFRERLQAEGLEAKLTIAAPVAARERDLRRFHSAEYLARVRAQSASGEGYLDQGDTPAFPGMYEAAGFVVGSVLDAIERILSGACRRAFVPIAGLHHARRNAAAGFCVFNDCGVAIEVLRQVHGIRRLGLRGHRRPPRRWRVLRLRGRPRPDPGRPARRRPSALPRHRRRRRDRPRPRPRAQAQHPPAAVCRRSRVRAGLAPGGALRRSAPRRSSFCSSAAPTAWPATPSPTWN